jgi:hypothetical protein
MPKPVLIEKFLRSLLTKRHPMKINAVFLSWLRQLDFHHVLWPFDPLLIGAALDASCAKRGFCQLTSCHSEVTSAQRGYGVTKSP